MTEDRNQCRAGVYAIRQISTDAVYLGSSSDVVRRRHEHLSALRRRVHGNAALQEAWDAAGEADFRFEALEWIADRRARMDRECELLVSTANKFNVVEVADIHAGGHTFSQTDAAFERGRDRVLDREIIKTWAVTEVSDEWRAAGKPFRDRLDSARDFTLRREFKSDVDARERIIAARLTKAM